MTASPAPDTDEVEISVFGPGFGECIVVHVGAGKWFIVDSCLVSSGTSKQPVAEWYLRSIGVDLATQVELLVATHWHDDHIRGLSRLVEACPKARVSYSAAMSSREFFCYVEALGTGSLATDGAKVSEIRKAMRSIIAGGRVVRRATAGHTLQVFRCEMTGAPLCTVRSLSPSDLEGELFLHRIALDFPLHIAPKRSATPFDPNLVSIVLNVEFNGFSLLLGADMELHSDVNRGWTSAHTEGMHLGVTKAGIVKAAHHGSSNGHHNEAWKDLVESSPITVVTPYSRLRPGQKLPTDNDLLRLQRASSHLYVTGNREGRGRLNAADSAVARTLRESSILVRSVGDERGQVRLRRRNTVGTWSVETFAPAHRWPAVA